MSKGESEFGYSFLSCLLFLRVTEVTVGCTYINPDAFSSRGYHFFFNFFFYCVWENRIPFLSEHELPPKARRQPGSDEVETSSSSSAATAAAVGPSDPLASKTTTTKTDDKRPSGFPGAGATLG